MRRFAVAAHRRHDDPVTLTPPDLPPKADEAQGLAAVYRAAQPDLLRFLIARTGDHAEAEDLMQELWIRLNQNAGGPVAHGHRYLFRMAHNLMIDRLRERQRRERRERAWFDDHVGRDPRATEPADPAPNAEETLLDRDEAASIAAAVANLPPGARRAFVLHKLRGLSHAEVATALGISRSGVEKHMTVAMKYLRRALFD
jgi:RNA polymerase sigma-70 factor (ECF subfamily)